MIAAYFHACPALTAGAPRCDCFDPLGNFFWKGNVPMTDEKTTTTTETNTPVPPPEPETTTTTTTEPTPKPDEDEAEA